jgi:hypothetical protein
MIFLRSGKYQSAGNCGSALSQLLKDGAANCERQEAVYREFAATSRIVMRSFSSNEL